MPAKTPSTTVSMFTRTVQVLNLLGIALAFAIAIPQCRRLSGEHVVDPARAFDPDLSAAPHLTMAIVRSSPTTYAVLSLTLLLVLATAARIVHLRHLGKPFSVLALVPLALCALIIAIGLVTAQEASRDSTEHTFATWAQQRYGIELETYPVRSGFFFSSPIDTHAVITLDDGQRVQVQQIIDARGTTAYTVINSTTAAELPVLAR